MKKIVLSVALAGTLASAVNLEYLSGDSKLACEAMLCLASPVQPAECSASLARYFSIHFKKPWKTVNARKAFLNLCPVESQDSEMLKYKNEILANLDGGCSVETLNQRVEKTLLRVEKVCESNGAGEGSSCRSVNIYGYRIDPSLTHSCKLLSSSAYTDYHLKYTCNGKFYEEKDWNNGFVETNGAKEEIKKQCWVNE
ncbi:TrbM/KikA/MpfK family conjugal transfer protein [Campylobacter upsaliensis]|uniref:Cpp45 n=1 Tax=Campylobacter upsaliensis TaxID=28080 RepID=A0A381F4X4_CAMUP|nr:TrbM/KikA/MpfK family conjugal transfer protein [Campylobacter upsaliensis]EAL52577.1 TraQ protein [Campylobacter upsaliensis RM3195]MCR2100867.1 TrbM/KikA/MpfK family conjugal transfer protein [Campylobacter upsaliensis]MCR2108822.1 TrbM/KikA/MpfK family conjugal transfer protein [Campylobacter upsaliensis]MCR2109992.1 TrbM/KikA/MpfK family conjugal transfer protein [Campylobacter upsaliensis]MCR2113732.1 TrbM/KikA/MpfK family conjugal transfer protein [Campylobacter upsaliensis]